ncbi:hypothetical protein BaRGS_00004234 [Batillaria attramentaria]|uniref:Uncharacterized protein n=1 Tax=Batillaria attramentaria TaxID=370345 RepID=A0ABD0LY59_9CAEN
MQPTASWSIPVRETFADIPTPMAEGVQGDWPWDMRSRGAREETFTDTNIRNLPKFGLTEQQYAMLLNPGTRDQLVRLLVDDGWYIEVLEEGRRLACFYCHQSYSDGHNAL